MPETENNNSPLAEDNNLTDNANPQHKSGSKKPLIAIFLLLLLLIGGYFYMSSGKKADTERIISLEEAKHQSDSLYNELKRELAIYKQENEELYTQIARKESELESQYSKIKRLIDQANRDKSARKEIQSKLQNLGVELDNMKKYVEGQTLDLEELRVENRRLRKEKEALDAQYEAELEQRARLELKGHNLENANEELNKKLNTASVLMTTNVNAVGLRLRNNGEKKGVALAKRTELIEVCFDIVKNEVCPKGSNRFFLRLLAPSGAVVKDEPRGSGKLKVFATGEEIEYTTSKIFDYNTSVKNICMEWFAYPNTPFEAGTYKVELYNKGRKVGTYDFTTK